MSFIHFLLFPPPSSYTLFPYTTLFLSLDEIVDAQHGLHDLEVVAVAARDVGHRGRVFRKARSAEAGASLRSEEHTSELQSPCNLVCRLLLEKKNSLTQRVEYIYNHRLIRSWSCTMLFSTDVLYSLPIVPTAFELYTLSLHDALPIS